MSWKIVLLFVMSMAAGIVFCAAGIYFLSDAFLRKMTEAAGQTEDSMRGIKFRCRGSGYCALALGALTFVWGILLFLFPIFAPQLALVYMIFLALMFAAVMFLFR